MTLAFRHPAGGKVEAIGGGWSWTLFFFSWFWGLPLFYRRLYRWGAIFIVLNIVEFAVVFGTDVRTTFPIFFLVTPTQFVLQLWLGFRGSELTARRYLEEGWVFADVSSRALAKDKWNLDDRQALDDAGTSRVEAQMATASIPPRKGSIGSGVFWMLFLSLLLFWLPIIGPFVAGLVGGRKAGDVGSAIAAVFIPGLVVGFTLFVVAGSLTGIPFIGAIAGIGGFALSLTHITPLLIGAIIGGLFA